MSQIEYDYYIPANVTIGTDGKPSSMDDVYNFDDRHDRFLKSFSGWGMPPINYVTQGGPFQHGETLLDFRLAPRTIQLVHRRNGCSRAEYWSNRLELLDKLRPNRQLKDTFEAGRLRKVLPDGSIRDVRAIITGGAVFTARDEGSWDEYAISESIQFIAHDPVVFNPVQKNVTWTIGVPVDYLVFPITFPILFGVSGFINTSVSVSYVGTWLSYPLISITGPLDSPTIYNLSTGEKITLNYNVPAGSTVVIDLGYGKKTVVENGGTNRIGVVTTDSDLATFHIAPEPEVAGGVNVFQVIGTNGTLATAVQMLWNDNYIGI